MVLPGLIGAGSLIWFGLVTWVVFYRPAGQGAGVAARLLCHFAAFGLLTAALYAQPLFLVLPPPRSGPCTSPPRNR
jgi:hypothetical protein